MTRLRLYLAGAVVLAILGFGIYSCHGRHVVTQETQQAAQAHEQGTTNAAQGAVHDQASANAQAYIDKANAEVERLKSELAKLRSGQGSPAHPGVSQPPVGHDGMGNAVGNGSLAAVIAKQDQIIQAQDARYAALEKMDAEDVAARDSWRSAANGFKAEAEHLRATIPTPHNLAMGLVYGSNGTIGACAEYDLGRVRLGVDLTTRPVLGSVPEVEILGRALWRM